MGRKYCPHGFPIQNRFWGMLRFRVVEKNFVEVWEVKARTFDTFLGRALSDLKEITQFVCERYGSDVVWNLDYKGDCEYEVVKYLSEVSGSRFVDKRGMLKWLRRVKNC